MSRRTWQVGDEGLPLLLFWFESSVLCLQHGFLDGLDLYIANYYNMFGVSLIRVDQQQSANLQAMISLVLEGVYLF